MYYEPVIRKKNSREAEAISHTRGSRSRRSSFLLAKEIKKKDPTITSERVPSDCNGSHYVSVVCISVYTLTCSNYRWLRSVLIWRSREREAPKMIWLASDDGAFSCVSLPYNTHDTSSFVGKGPGRRNTLI